MEISDLTHKEFKVMLIKMLIRLGRRTNEHSENFKENKNIRNYPIEVIE